jgi:DNA-binding transcriptional MerR regulator
MAGLQIGKLAARAGVARSAIRYYERIGILTRGARTAAGYRVYPERAIVELRFVGRAQALGFSLDEIRGFLDLQRSGRSPCDRLVTAARRRLREADEELRALTAFRDALANRIAGWTACGPEVEGSCALIECPDDLCVLPASPRHSSPKGLAPRTP